MKQITILLALIVLASCKKETTVTTVTSSLDRDEKNMKKIRNQALVTGSDESYGYYLEYCAVHKPDEQLSFSLLFNYKHKTPKSYYWTYANIIQLYNNNRFKTSNFANLDEANRDFAFHYLLEGAKLNATDCRAELEKIYRNGWGVPKDQVKADSIYALLEKVEYTGNYYRKYRNERDRMDN